MSSIPGVKRLLPLPDLSAFDSPVSDVDSPVSNAKRFVPPPAPNARRAKRRKDFSETKGHPLHLLNGLNELNKLAKCLGNGNYFTVYLLESDEWNLFCQNYWKEKDVQMNFPDETKPFVVKVIHWECFEKTTKEKMESTQEDFERLQNTVNQSSVPSVQLPITEFYSDRGIIIQEYLPDPFLTDEETKNLTEAESEEELSSEIKKKLLAVRGLIRNAILKKVPLDLSWDNLRVKDGKYYMHDPVERSDLSERWYLQFEKTLLNFMNKNFEVLKQILIKKDPLINDYFEKFLGDKENPASFEIDFEKFLEQCPSKNK